MKPISYIVPLSNANQVIKIQYFFRFTLLHHTNKSYLILLKILGFSTACYTNTAHSIVASRTGFHFFVRHSILKVNFLTYVHRQIDMDALSISIFRKSLVIFIVLKYSQGQVLYTIRLRSKPVCDYECVCNKLNTFMFFGISIEC